MKTVDQMLVTPEQAEAWYSMSSGNRSVRRTVVVRYAEEMKRGRWGVNHQGYLIDQRGGTIDGHHRQLAQVESRMPIRINVTFLEAGDPMFSALESEIDRGAVRNDADVTGLQKRLVSVCNAIPVIARKWITINRRTAHGRLLPVELVKLSDVVNRTMKIGRGGHYGMTSIVQAIFVCAIHATGDQEIERQWDLLVSDEELPGKWPLAVKVRRDMFEGRRTSGSRYSNMGGSSDRSERFISLWWLALHPRFRTRGTLSGLHACLAGARDEVALAANGLLEEAIPSSGHPVGRDG
jgi:hypothetical protein